MEYRLTIRKDTIPVEIEMVQDDKQDNKFLHLLKKMNIP